MEEREEKGEPTPHEVAEAVRAYLLGHPEMRLGQALIVLSTRDARNPFYMSDRRLVELLTGGGSK